MYIYYPDRSVDVATKLWGEKSKYRGSIPYWGERFSLLHTIHFDSATQPPSSAELKNMNLFFLFQLNAHNLLNTYIYHQLPPTCFGVCYTIFREPNALFTEEMFVFCNVVVT
jgi:hypothetical protein